MSNDTIPKQNLRIFHWLWISAMKLGEKMFVKTVNHITITGIQNVMHNIVANNEVVKW